METKEQKLANQKFTLKSRYGETAIDIALCGWSRYKGPCYDKIWFTEEFEIFCWCAKTGLDKQKIIVMKSQYASQQDQERDMYHGTLGMQYPPSSNE
jgi:hypothetical protein